MVSDTGSEMKKRPHSVEKDRFWLRLAFVLFRHEFRQSMENRFSRPRKLCCGRGDWRILDHGLGEGRNAPSA